MVKKRGAVSGYAPAPAVIGAVTALLEYARWLSQSKEIHHPGFIGYRIGKLQAKAKGLTTGFLIAIEKRHRFTVVASPFHRRPVTVSPSKTQKWAESASPFHRA
jgi:hypothetical protein